MTKPTGTTLDVSNNISGSNFNPQFSDAAGLDPLARKSSITSARVARSASIAEASAVHVEASYPSRITVQVSTTATTKFTFPNGSNVASGGQITLQSQDTSNANVFVGFASSSLEALSYV